MVILHTKADRGTVIPYTYNEIGERTIHHMDECGWMDTQRGKNCIYQIYDGIHHNALKLNKEHMSDNGLTQIEATQTTNDTANTILENKDTRKREDGQPNTNNAQATDIYTTNSTMKADIYYGRSESGKHARLPQQPPPRPPRTRPTHSHSFVLLSLLLSCHQKKYTKILP